MKIDMDINAEIVLALEKVANRFQEKHQLWFDKNTEDEQDPDVVHNHYIPNGTTGSFGFLIKKESNMSVTMKNELQTVLSDALKKFEAK